VTGQTAWIESLSPWPEEFGLGRMRALLTELGEPQRPYPAIHVVGTNGKSTATRRAAAFLAREGLAVGAYTSPHVSGWSERIQVDGEDVDFAAAEVDVAVVEAGLGGRLDATNVLDARVVVLTNVSLDHTDVLGDSREQIAREKLAVVTPGATVVLGEPEWEHLARERGAARIVRAEDVGRAAAEAFLGRELGGEVEASLPGRLDFSGDDVFAGAHNPAGVDWLVARLPRNDYVVCAAILADKDARSMLGTLAGVGSSFVATQTETERTLAADELAQLAREFFADVESVPDATTALDCALERARPGGGVLVTGSLYLLRDLFGRLETVR